MNSSVQHPGIVWRETYLTWSVLGVIAVLLWFVFRDGLTSMVEMWFKKEEYSHAVMIPFITLFLIWQKKDELEQTPFTGSLVGMGAVFLGLFAFFLGQLSASVTIIQYAFLITLMGSLLAYMGWTAFRLIAIPLFMLVFMIPLPGFLYEGFSAKLQLLSSELGVALIQMFGISVYLEGNVIDLGTLKLQVVDACSGLRYLFPLMTLGFIAAYFFKAAFWKRAVVFLSSIPITILMNSIRVGLIGIAVEYWGKSMAEGFLHDFEGWAVFMACTGVLVAEMWVLARVGRDGRPLREVFGLDFPGGTPAGSDIRRRPMSRTLPVVALLLGVGVALALMLPHRTEVQPQRKEFVDFPMNLSGWQGRGERLEPIYVDALKFDDYILADYMDQSQQTINLYVGYYGSQRSGKVPHSPRACLPGGGWEIGSFTQRSIPGASDGSQPIVVNRTLIQHGTDRQLVYYWFQQRGRVLTSEYLVKWFIFWDALTRNRTDGALVRLMAPLKPGQDVAEVDQKLASFVRAMEGTLPSYIPD